MNHCNNYSKVKLFYYRIFFRSEAEIKTRKFPRAFLEHTYLIKKRILTSLFVGFASQQNIYVESNVPLHALNIFYFYYYSRGRCERNMGTGICFLPLGRKKIAIQVRLCFVFVLHDNAEVLDQKSIDRWMDELIEKYIDGWMDGRIDRQRGKMQSFQSSQEIKGKKNQTRAYLRTGNAFSRYFHNLKKSYHLLITICIFLIQPFLIVFCL